MRCPDEDAGGFDCVNLELDNENCGACGTVCGDGEACLGHQCTCKRTSCTNDAGVTVCTDPEHDPRNCGACGQACGPTEICHPLGTGCFNCSPSIPCNPDSGVSACVDPSNMSSENCGGCGIQCQNGETCLMMPGGLPACGCGDGGPGTNPVDCAEVCTDAAHDLFNCGACGNVCAFDEPCIPGDAGTGVCECNAPLQWCGPRCVDTRSDLEHCGGCTACSPPATECILGKCR